MTSELEQWNGTGAAPALTPDEEKEVMGYIAQDCLARLEDEPLEWLPTSMLALVEGSHIHFWMNITMDDVDPDVMARTLIRERAERGIEP